MSTIPPHRPALTRRGSVVLTRRGSIVVRVLALLMIPVIIAVLAAVLVASDLEGALGDADPARTLQIG